MPLVQRFTGVAPGAMVLTGNALSIRTGTNFPPAGVDYLNGSYISTNTALTAAAGFPNGTTFNSSQNSSTAVLNMPPGSTVLYAQLIWRMYAAPTPDANINLILPSNTSLTISPDLLMRQTIGGLGGHVFQAQDVTTIVDAAGPGTYTVGGVPGPTISNGSTISPSSWYLMVVYKNQNLPYRYFNVNTGLVFVNSANPAVFNFTGFSTPTFGSVRGYLVIAGTDGDLTDRAKLVVGPNSTAITTIGNPSLGVWNGAAPYAQIDNILPGNILIADANDPNIGLLDTRGNFGTFNKNPFNTSAPAYARVNVDILGVDISQTLANNQNSLYTRIFYTTGGTSEMVVESTQVDVNSANIGGMTKTVDKPYASVGDVLTYTVRLPNSGLASAQNVVFMDTVPANTNFVSGSVSINGVTSVTANPALPGIDIESIDVNQVVTVNFRVIVNSTIPSYGIINTGQVTYTYYPAPGLPIQYSSASASATTTLVDATISKSISPSNFRCGTTITYTNVYQFLSVPTTISNIVFQDTVPANTTFIPNSVVINGATISGANPTPPGFTVAASITLPTVFTINFNASANTLIQTATISNSSTSVYSFFNGVNTETIALNTSIVNATLDPFCSSITKSVDKAFADIGDTITYTMVITNGGITLNNVIFKDTIPTGTSIVANSFNDGGSIIPGANPDTGVGLSTIGANSTRTITFQVIVDTIPTINPISNSATTTLNYTLYSTNDSSESLNTSSVTTQINHGSLSGTKSVSKIYADIGDTLTYTVTFNNNGNVTCTNIVFLDTIPIGTSYVPSSLTVNGATQIAPANPPGINIPDIGPGSITTIVFNVTVNTIPTVNPIPNSGNTRYGYVVGGTDSRAGSYNTNLVNTQVNNASLNGIAKSVDKVYGTCGDILTYTITLPNNGNVTATNVVFKDTIPLGTSLISNSVTLNGTTIPGGNPQSGINVGAISAGASAVVKFSVQINC